jgi:hypothetical protein
MAQANCSNNELVACLQRFIARDFGWLCFWERSRSAFGSTFSAHLGQCRAVGFWHFRRTKWYAPEI